MSEEKLYSDSVDLVIYGRVRTLTKYSLMDFWYRDGPYPILTLSTAGGVFEVFGSEARAAHRQVQKLNNGGSRDERDRL